MLDLFGLQEIKTLKPEGRISYNSAMAQFSMQSFTLFTWHCLCSALIQKFGFDPEICGLFRIVENGKTVRSDLSLSDDIFISLTMHIALVMSGIPEEPV